MAPQPIVALHATESPQMKRGFSKVSPLRFLQNWFLLTVWVTATGALFSWAYFRYHHEPRYFYTRQILGQWLCVSRGTAAVLNLCMVCIVFPVSRFLHLIMAKLSMPKKMAKTCTLILMHSKRFHIICAVTLIIASVVHTLSHLVNAYNYSTNYNYKYPDLNWGAPGQTAFSLIITSVVGLSGIGMLLVLFLMAFTSMDRARNSHYNYFWLSHHLALPLLLLYLIHPLSHVIKEVSNLEQHNPVDCSDENESAHSHHYHNSTRKDCETPIFHSPQSNAWKWLLIPSILMATDLALRAASLFKNSVVRSIAVLPGNAIEIFISSQGFRCNPGQYVLIQIPQASTLEWHPFTIVKCPSDKDNKFSIIIKSRGDWTKKACKELINHFVMNGSYYKQPISLRICMFGPFASPMEQMLNCKNLVCIGAGVGVTPFMSYIKYLLENEQTFQQIEHLKFVWLCPDPSQLLWFSWTISSLHNQFWDRNKPDAFSYAIYITKNFNSEELNSLMETKYPLVAARVCQGRPNWEQVFQSIKLEFSNKSKVRVFGCGPGPLMKELENRSREISKGKTNFNLIHEAYS